MSRSLAAVAAALAIPLLAVAACSSQKAEPPVVTVTSTVPPATPSSSTEPVAVPSSAPVSPAPVTGGENCGAVGFTGAPGLNSPHCLDTQIASCGTSVHEFGTTFFTDGTSGWTQYCDNQMRANYVPPTYSQAPATPTFDQDAYNKQFAEDYWKTHPKPTYNPDSADGYGTNQVLPPACLRLKGVDC